MNLVILYLAGMLGIAIVSSALIVWTHRYYENQVLEDASEVFRRIVEG